MSTKERSCEDSDEAAQTRNWISQNFNLGFLAFRTVTKQISVSALVFLLCPPKQTSTHALGLRCLREECIKCVTGRLIGKWGIDLEVASVYVEREAMGVDAIHCGRF